MRLETTISEARREQLRALQAELKLSTSRVVDEALSMFLKAYMETKRGNRLAIIEAESKRTVCEVASPGLSQVEWAFFRRSIKLSTAAAKKVRRMSKRPAAPTAALRKAMARRRRTA